MSVSYIPPGTTPSWAHLLGRGKAAKPRAAAEAGKGCRPADESGHYKAVQDRANGKARRIKTAELFALFKSSRPRMDG